MYSGLEFSNISGSIAGTHQKINRVAYKRLCKSLSTQNFPNIRMIQHFEGKNGPDGIKVKSPAVDEPWHYFDPYDPDDTELLALIRDHYTNLVKHLRDKNNERAAFEASWLAHALVDGMTPAHHFPYEDELAKIRGKDRDNRTTIKEKIMISGDSPSDMVNRNWQFWGAKGLFTTHFLFEWGVAAVGLLKRYKPLKMRQDELQKIRSLGIEEFFAQSARRVAQLNMYDRFYQRGWTPRLAKTTTQELLPEIINVVSLVWAQALHESGMGAQLRSS